MALRLVRQTSDTPNITNKDDTVMVRYAYGGYNGVVKNFGNECDYVSENGVFKVLSGRIALDGWEIDVDGAGWILDLHSVIGTQYYSIYTEISIIAEDVKINSKYLSNSYPEIDKGDDLTEIPNGTARLLLYSVKVENGVITEVIKKFSIIPYLAQKVLNIEERLDKLGFKPLPSLVSRIKVGAGNIDIGSFKIWGNRIASEPTDSLLSYRQGNLVVLACTLEFNAFNLLLDANTEVYNFLFEGETIILDIQIPEEFRPRRPQTLYCYIETQLMATSATDEYSKINIKIPCIINVTIDKTGEVRLKTSKSIRSLSNMSTTFYSSYSMHAGIQFGYLVDPIA